MSHPQRALRSAVDQLDHLQHRVVLEALSSAEAATWRRRAEALEWARPRPGDFTGRASAADLAARDRRLARMAELCRHRASICDVESWAGAA